MDSALFLDGDQWKAWNGRLLVSLMRGQRIAVLQLDQRGVAIDDSIADLPATRTRTLVQGPDGSLYTANDAGEIWRVAPH
jgi:glucose/arabinose dehydrogenase